jgi:hypothetical protein
MSNSLDNGTKYCNKCKKEVMPVIKMFNTAICPICHVILSSDKAYKG